MLTTAIEAAKAAGAIMLDHAAQTKTVRFKDSYNIVSDVDVAAEKIILEILQKNFPNHSIFSEEQGLTDRGSDYVWVVDPLDGSTNYIRNLHHADVSIALVRNNQVQIGVVYDPFHDELFAAEAGKGATLNGGTLQPNATTDMDKVLLNMGRSGSADAKQDHGNLLAHLTNKVRSIRVMGATALNICYVAAGRFDGHIYHQCAFYDCAAANLIAQESGLLVTDLRGEPWQLDMEQTSDLLVTTSTLQPKFLEAIRNQ